MSDDRGMVPRSTWEQTLAHKFTRGYSCNKCGAEFTSPHEFYAHLDAEHPAKKAKAKR